MEGTVKQARLQVIEERAVYQAKMEVSEEGVEGAVGQVTMELVEKGTGRASAKTMVNQRRSIIV